MPLATPSRPMPAAETLSHFLGLLLGQFVAVTKTKELNLPQRGHELLTGVFVDDDGEIGGACVCDIDFAARAGAALAMIPAAAADEAIAANTLGDSLRENYYEVANIATRLVNGPSVPHVKITELVDGVPDAVRDLLMSAVRRCTYQVQLDGYGPGTISLYAR
jgi:hypothetical protein